MKTQVPRWIHPPTPLSKASNIYTSADTLRPTHVQLYATWFSFGSRNTLPFYDTIPNHITSGQHPWLPPETTSSSTCTSQLVSVIHTYTNTWKGKRKAKVWKQFQRNGKDKKTWSSKYLLFWKKKKKTQCWGINNIQDRLTQMGSP